MVVILVGDEHAVGHLDLKRLALCFLIPLRHDFRDE